MAPGATIGRKGDSRMVLSQVLARAAIVGVIGFVIAALLGPKIAGITAGIFIGGALLATANDAKEADLAALALGFGAGVGLYTLLHLNVIIVAR